MKTYRTPIQSMASLRRCAVTVALGAVLAGCAHAPAAPKSGADPAHACSALSGRHIPAALIGLPTAGATIAAAQWIAEPPPRNPNGSYCAVNGAIFPDAAAAASGTPEIRFRLNLPERWNGRSLQMGGDGYDGHVVAGTGAIAFTVWPPPLSQGYATFGSDGGHSGNSESARFALNEGALRNYGHEHIKKTHDAAIAILRQWYGRLPEKSYFAGASTGGREAMTALQRYPADYDGIIANAPALNFWGMRLIGVRIGQAAYRVPGGFLPKEGLDLIRSAVLAACDSDDGLVDGIVANVAACRAKQESIVASLRCPGDGSRPCLPDAQLGTALIIAGDLVLPYRLAHGANRYQAYDLFQGADFGNGYGLGKSQRPLSPPTVGANGYLFTQGDSYLKYMVARDPGKDSLAFDIERPGALEPRLLAVSEIVGAMNPDTAAFQRRGGKLIVLQGLADDVVSPNATVAYYREQIARYGRRAVDGYFRLYLVPGFGHGGGSFIPAWPALDALDRWATAGQAPGTLTGIDANPATRGRSRPLCPYPEFARYRGQGNPDAAASFFCAAQ